MGTRTLHQSSRRANKENLFLKTSGTIEQEVAGGYTSDFRILHHNDKCFITGQAQLPMINIFWDIEFCIIKTCNLNCMELNILQSMHMQIEYGNFEILALYMFI